MIYTLKSLQVRTLTFSLISLNSYYLFYIKHNLEEKMCNIQIKIVYHISRGNQIFLYSRHILLSYSHHSFKQ